ncbi:MAG: PAS domain S-box protein, partial [Candidatus Marithrix sp.]
LLLTLSGVMAVLIASSIIDPIIQLKRKIEEIEKGNWNYQIVINTKDEIGQLSIVFNRMITKIKNTQDQLHIHHNELEAQVADRTIELRKKISEIEQQKLGIQTLALNLQANKQRYENLVNSIDGIVWEADSTTFQFTFISKQAEHLVGYPYENWLLPNFWMEHIHPDERNNILEHRTKAVLHKKHNISEYRLLAKNNSNIWVKDLVNVEIQNNQVIKLYGVMFDITENKRLEIALQNISNRLEIRVKKRTQELNKTNEKLQTEIIERKQIEEELTLYHDHLEELVKERTIKLNQINSQLQAEIIERKQIQEALQDSDEKNRLLLNSAPEAIYGLDLQGNCTFCNPACVKLLGYANAGDLINKNIHNLIHHTNADGSHHPMKQCNIYDSFIKGKGTHISDEILWRADNTNFPAEYWSYPIFKNGKTIGSVVTFIDITERKQAEEKLQHSEARFRKMFEEGPIGMVISDPNLNITKANAAFCQMIGYTETELLQINIEDISHPDDMITNAKLVQKSNNGEISFYQMEKRYLRKDERTICCNLSVSFFRDNDGKITYFLAKIEDITERKKTETDLKKARDAADTANKAKSEFLANMSHEIRTPMNAVIGFSNILASQITDKKQKSYLNSIQTAGKGLLNLINDILDLSKIEAGRLDIQYEPVNLLIIFAELQQIFTLKIAEKNLEFIIDIDVELPTRLMLDEIRLRQVLLNLIGNAIKFTDTGYIKLSAKQNITEQQLDLIITVEDSGIGIPADQQTIIFESFKQQDGQSTRKYGGTGLGLSISKRLVEMMNGQISVSSISGKGSSFKVILQKVKIAITTKPILKHIPFQQYTFENAQILVVDDIESNRNLIKEYLFQVNLTVIEAKNGQEALLLAEQYQPDLILMDLRMPVMNGHDATAHLKSNPHTAKIPIIALTASVEEKVKSHYFNDFLSKPVNISDLLNKLFYYLKYDKNIEPNLPIEISSEIPIIITIELKNSLIKEIIPFLAEINTAMEMDMISECANYLIILGKKHNIAIFIQHGKQLLESAKTFNIADIQKILKELSTIIESLIGVQDATHD